MSQPMTIVQCMSCPDQPGIVHEVCAFVLDMSANIVHLEQHVDGDDGLFFMRLVWQPKVVHDMHHFQAAFAPLKQRFNMTCDWHDMATQRRMAVLVSKQTHCLYDVLARYQSQQWHVTIPVVLSNHNDCAPICHQFGVPFVHVPIVAGDKAAQEAQLIAHLETHQVDTIVLARYMQILSADFVARYPQKIINIHHSFLPAFMGAKPYHQAHSRGVKMIGATSHYVTSDLDQGPIIAQDTRAISHRDNTAALVQIGQEIEKRVFNAAITAHLHHKVLVFNKKTIVFA